MTTETVKTVPTTRRRLLGNRRTPRLAALLSDTVQYRYDPFFLHNESHERSGIDFTVDASALAEIAKLHAILATRSCESPIWQRAEVLGARAGAAAVASSKISGPVSGVMVAFNAIRQALNSALDVYLHDVKVTIGHETLHHFVLSQSSQMKLVESVMDSVKKAYASADPTITDQAMVQGYLADKAPNVVSFPDDVEDSEGRLTPTALRTIQAHADKQLQAITSVEIEPF